MNRLTDYIRVTAFLIYNDEKRFLRLYRTYTPVLYPFLLRSLNHNYYITEEIVQETWVRAVQNVRSFKWNSSFKTWLFGIAINVRREFLRENFKSSEDVSSIESELNPAVDLLQKVDFENAISLLPEGYKNVYILHDVNGFKHREIAEMLGIEVGTSKSQLSHARAAMRKFLTEKN